MDSSDVYPIPEAAKRPPSQREHRWDLPPMHRTGDSVDSEVYTKSELVAALRAVPTDGPVCIALHRRSGKITYYRFDYSNRSGVGSRSVSSDWVARRIARIARDAARIPEAELLA